MEQKAFTFFLTWAPGLGTQTVSAALLLMGRTVQLPGFHSACTLSGKHHAKSQASLHQYSHVLQVSQFSNWGYGCCKIHTSIF